MIRILCLTFLGLVTCQAQLTIQTQNKIADAIYRVEGGHKARKPYGILSVNVKTESEARKICINTINNNYSRWNKQTAQSNFLDFLANRYCPPSVDPVGNRNWKRNIKSILGASKCAELTHKQKQKR